MKTEKTQKLLRQPKVSHVPQANWPPLRSAEIAIRSTAKVLIA
jgi:hypothetical protein